MQPRRQHQITRIRKPLIVSRGRIHLQYTRIAVAFGQVSRETGGRGGWVTPWVPETFMRGFRFPSSLYSRNDDGDGNENGKKALSLLSKTTTLHVQHTFFVHFCLYCTTTTWKSPNFMSVFGGRELKTKTFLFFCDKVWGSVTSLFKWRFRSRRRRRCLRSLVSRAKSL